MNVFSIPAMSLDHSQSCGQSTLPLFTVTNTRHGAPKLIAQRVLSLREKFVLSVHDSILSKVEASSKSGAIHSLHYQCQ
uniref:Uncharacterized protein n=1 Tax=Candidatus Nitrotoga fabula TaxID=2182327 RepID=A0A2X0QUZ4_9PROT|nr:protein of unknown function [Candidatus Nitrotoga fabula]